MNAKQREQYWRKFQLIRNDIEKKYINSIQKSIFAQFEGFAKDIDKIGVEASISKLGLNLWEKDLIKVFEGMYKESVVTFGNAVYRALKIEANQKAETFGFNAQWTKEILEFLMIKGFTLVSGITQTTKKRLIDIANAGVQEGLSVDDIVKLVLDDKELEYSNMRARRIVRTEVMRGSNIGAMKGAEAHGFQVDKQWISARDSRTRRIPDDEFDHVELDGVIVPFDQPFTSNGKKGEAVVAMQPGDISAPAGFTINCRCTVGFIPKRDANGRLIMKPKVGGVNIKPNINFQNVVNQSIEVTKPLTKEDISANIKSIFSNNTNLKVNKVNIPPNLTVDQLTKRQETLQSLTSEYKLSPAINNTYDTTISFQSTAKSYGYVRCSNDGRVIYEANFGDRVGDAKYRTFNEDFKGIRFKSRVDEKNLDQSTTVHEFAHLMSLRHQLKQFNAPEELVKYYKELRKINNLYKKELKEYYSKEDMYNVNQISLGDYASTNIDEFMAESFTEYRLSSKPSKYAVLVGKLIDKYFKK
jgi:ribosomal protein L23